MVQGHSTEHRVYNFSWLVYVTLMAPTEVLWFLIRLEMHYFFETPFLTPWHTCANDQNYWVILLLDYPSIMHLCIVLSNSVERFKKFECFSGIIQSKIVTHRVGQLLNTGVLFEHFWLRISRWFYIQTWKLRALCFQKEFFLYTKCSFELLFWVHDLMHDFREETIMWIRWRTAGDRYKRPVAIDHLKDLALL